MYITKDCDKNILIANYDIKVLKILGPSMKPYYKPNLYKYDFNILTPEIKLQPILYNNLWCINEGYHSYDYLIKDFLYQEILESHSIYNRGKRKYLYEAIIPKNTFYYFDSRHSEYVSSKLIIKKLLEL